MIKELIEYHQYQWLNSDECTVKPILDYIKSKGKLREAQYQAIETYLFLKIKGENKPLWKLLSEGFFSADEDLSKLNINQLARETLESNKAAKSLFDVARFKVRNGNSNQKLSPELEQYIIDNPNTIDYENLIKKFFYDINYTDYLFSLPMGAGKTFLMAAIIYLDLYFASNEPQNTSFAHNFIILVPSGLKTSIIPSLKTIERFDPSWVIPEPSASKLKNLIKFEILDQPKSAKKSNKARNPNAQKVNNHQPFDDLMGLVMIVNAEKVILENLEFTDQGELIVKTDDERKNQANELRNIISKIPHLQIHIDEVHHAATNEIKLRQVVTKWNEDGLINSVLGFSGTPYLMKRDKIKLSDDVTILNPQIANTVFYYPLTTAIEKFLKKPRVEQVSGMTSLQIIEKGVNDFIESYNEKVYDDGTIAKVAIYCGNIRRLEEEVYPFLVDKMKISPELILKYHRGNKQYKLPIENDTEFASLDTPLSKKKIILLVQIGKEGWDCKSLTGVILSQEGDCPRNMVLQTSCRCLREVDKGKDETAIIWLNEKNAKSLDKQLRKEQLTSIAELNKLSKTDKVDEIERYSRIDFLKLPKIEFYQLKVEYNTFIIEEHPNTKNKIEKLNAENYSKIVIQTSGDLNLDADRTKDIIETIKGESINFNDWTFEIIKGSMGSLKYIDLIEYNEDLKRIFKAITITENNQTYYNDKYDIYKIQSQIRLAFHCKRDFKVETEKISQSAQMLIIKKLSKIPKNDLLYPKQEDVQKILEMDNSGNMPIEKSREKLENDHQKMIELLEKEGFSNIREQFSLEEYIQKNSSSMAVKSKNSTFHYLPYNFWQSNFELKFLKEALSLDIVKKKNLEIYYNGEKHLTDFRIVCYAKNGNNYQRIGRYTPDFLLIKRNDNSIEKVLIIETKGSGFAEQTNFVLRRKYMENDFLQINNEKFGYKKFEFLYLQDDDGENNNLVKLNNTIKTFFDS